MTLFLMSPHVCVRVSVSVHVDQVVTALTPSKSYQYHMQGKWEGGDLNLTLLSFKVYVCLFVCF